MVSGAIAAEDVPDALSKGVSDVFSFNERWRVGARRLLKIVARWRPENVDRFPDRFDLPARAGVGDSGPHFPLW